MKNFIPILALCAITSAFFIGFWHGHKKIDPLSQPLRLEQILSIKELHLVKHVYQDLFFVHKKNDQSKSIRAIVQMPVEITAYLNLKEIEVLYQHDSIKQVILPRACLNAPHYKVDQMKVRGTHKIQIHVGRDLYPEVNEYLSELLNERLDTVRNLAAANRILVQAETEGKTYIEELLKSVGRADVIVTFADETTNHQVIQNDRLQKRISLPANVHNKGRVEKLSFGFIPIACTDHLKLVTLNPKL